MAYAAVTCARSTIRRLQNRSQISIVSSTRTNLELAYDELGSLQKFLKRSGGRSSSCGSRLNALDGEIILVVQKLEDSLEFHELNISPSQSYGDVTLMDDISRSVETAKKIKYEYNEELAKSLPEGDADDDNGDKGYEDNPLKVEEDDYDYNCDEERAKKMENEDDDGGGADGEDLTWNMVGLSDQSSEIKQSLIGKQNNTYLFSIVGMAGIGKTALAKRIFHDPFISKKFECRAFFRIGQNHKLGEMKRAILAQLNPSYDELTMDKENDEKINEHLKEFLDNNKYLIVLDDVWDLNFWNDYFKHRRGDKAAKGSRILFTTRLEGLPLSLRRTSYFYMPFLDKLESWLLLRGMVFGDEPCPPELEDAGMEIADKCDGLPLMLVTVADILSKEAERAPEYWNKAARRRNSLFEDAYDRILPVLYPSYYNLPPQQKLCFLYMAAFPPGHQVRRSKLVNLWSTDGFLEAEDDSTSLTSFASRCFDRIVLDHIVVPAPHLSSDGQSYQACSLHAVFRHLCMKELANNLFLHVVDGYYDHQVEGEEMEIRHRRRISIHHNVLLSVKDVRTSIGSSTTARSLLCTGPYHQYQVPIDFNLRLLRLCDALTIRFYEFPLEVLELLQLRYFTMTCNKNLPPFISKLWKLKYLIVHQHLSIITTVAESYLPVEIWDLQELKHLQIMGRNLPNPPSHHVVLPHLVKLLDVGTCTCTEGVLKSLPNLQKLRVQIHLTPNYSVEPLSYLNNISKLDGLLSLQCVIMNPIFASEIVSNPPLSFSPSFITKLTLSGLGYPWNFMNKFDKLPHLQVLKLLWFAFRGHEWQVEEKGFLKLECLSIEENDLVQWKAGKGTFPMLSNLTLKSCYKLKEIPMIPSYDRIELVDCNPAVVKCAKEMDCYCVTSSWDDEVDSLNYISRIYATY